MTVEELKKELDGYFDDMEVFIADEATGGQIALEFVTDDFVSIAGDHIHHVVLVPYKFL